MVLTSREILWQEVHWPSPLDSAAALALLQRLASDTSRQPVIWEARSDQGTITHLVGTAVHQVREITTVITSLVPGVTLTPISNPRNSHRRSARLRVNPRTLLLDTKKPARAARILLGALIEAHFRNEQATVQVVLGRGIRPQTVGAHPADPTQSLLGAIALGSRRASAELANQMREKSAGSGFRATVRIAVIAKSEPRRLTIMRGLLAAMRTLESAGTRVNLKAERPGRLDAAIESTWTSLKLSSSEILGLLAWPLDAEDLPGMPSPHPKLLPLMAGTPETTRVFAMTSAPGKQLPIGISVDAAKKHTAVTGPTGSGKSGIFLSLALRDAEVGRGLVVIDPKTDLARDFMARLDPRRHDDVVVLNPLSSAVVGLNPLHIPGASPELVADGILNIFRDLFPGAFGPRVDEVTHAAILTLAHHSGATLTWLPRLLSDTAFRARLIGQISDPDGLDQFWARYNDLSTRQQTQFMEPVLSRLSQLLLRSSVRRVLDQSEPRFALNDVFTKNKILVVSLNSGTLGKGATALLGSLLTSSLMQLTLARGSVPESAREPVSIFVDELQEFVRFGGDELSDALGRSRSMGVAWHFAMGYRDIVRPDLLQALDANARNQIVFRLGAKDARAMAAMAPELSMEDFMALPNFSIYASLQNNDKPGWVSGHTLPPVSIVSDADDLVAASEARYGRVITDEPDGATSADPGTVLPRSDATIGRRKRSAS